MSKFLKHLYILFFGGSLKVIDFIVVEISLCCLDKSVSNVLENLNKDFWFVKMWSMQVGMCDNV